MSDSQITPPTGPEAEGLGAMMTLIVRGFPPGEWQSELPRLEATVASAAIGMAWLLRQFGGAVVIRADADLVAEVDARMPDYHSWARGEEPPNPS